MNEQQRTAMEQVLDALTIVRFCVPPAQRPTIERAIETTIEALAQPEQEPVAIIHRNEYNEYRLEPHDNFDIKSIPFNVDVPLFKSPQRKPLTDTQIKKAMMDAKLHFCGEVDLLLARAIEAAHGIKE